MKTHHVLLSLLACVSMTCMAARAQVFGSSQRTITVQVSAITLVQVSAGVVNLSITAASVVAGQDAMTMTDQSTSLLWGTNSSGRKITVSTSLAAPKYTLRLLALNPTAGTAAPEVTLSTASTDLLLNIGRTSGSCSLQYTAIALASTGSGSDSHTITFTVLAQ